MNKHRLLNAALALVLVGLWVFVVATRFDATRRNFRWIPQMEDPIAFESQRGVLPTVKDAGSGRAAPGTIARGFLPLPYQAAAADAARAGRELKNPSAATPENLQRGAMVYSNFCSPCHGRLGLGDGPVTKRGVPPPPSLLGEKTMALEDGRMFHIITFGQVNMPPYASQVGREDRWKAILYVRALQAGSKEKAP